MLGLERSGVWQGPRVVGEQPAAQEGSLLGLHGRGTPASPHRSWRLGVREQRAGTENSTATCSQHLGSLTLRGGWLKARKCTRRLKGGQLRWAAVRALDPRPVPQGTRTHGGEADQGRARGGALATVSSPRAQRPLARWAVTSLSALALRVRGPAAPPRLSARRMRSLGASRPPLCSAPPTDGEAVAWR